MRPSCAIMAVVVCTLCAVTAWSEETFPYTGYITANKVRVRCDPSRNHVPTGHLDRDAQVEVYRHDPGGWYAIRPPEGSFSWVPARYLKMTDREGVAQVTQDGVRAWMGTNKSDARLAWQVRLEQGELVEVLGSKRLVTEAGSTAETMHKIASPSGEFRWVYGKYVSRQSPDQAEESSTGKTGSTGKAGWISRPASSEQTGSDSSAARSTVKKPRAVAARRKGSRQDELSDIDLELSVVVSQDPASWQLARLRERARVLLDGGKTAVQRGRARLLLEKIAQFEDIQNRHVQIAASNPTPDPSSEAVAVADTSAPRATAPRLNARYDGSGWLMPLIANRRGARSPSRYVPQFALTDDRGRILQLVTPAPGVNIRRYLRQKVGVYGQRDYLPRQKTPHLTAQRLEVLERHRR